MVKTMNDFTGLYKLSQTLMFELRPIGKTKENLEKSGLLDSDFKRGEDYPKVKVILDEIHKEFLQNVLSEFTESWEALANVLAIFQNDKTVENKNILKKFRKITAKKL